MLHPLPSAQSAEEANRFQSSSPYRTSIHILNDDVLLNVFYLYLPIFSPVDEDIDYILKDWQPDQERLWYKLAHICRRWRSLILASASYLHLCLLCTYRTPVAEMLAHSPPLPLTIDYFDGIHDVTTEDEEGILLALEHRDRVRSIRLDMPVQSLQMLSNAIDDEFAILQCLLIKPLKKEITSLELPKTFRAPHLRHLFLSNFAFPIGSQLLTTAQPVNLVSLLLGNILPSAHFHPNDLLQLLLLIPQLEALSFYFHYPVPNRDVERQLLHSPMMTHITLPNLRDFLFGGTSTYLEALLPCMTIPLLTMLYIEFFGQLSFPLPHLLQFLSTIENLRFSQATLTFGEHVSLSAYPRGVAWMKLLSMEVNWGYLDWQVAFAVQIINSLTILFSSVEDFTLNYTDSSSVLPDWPIEGNRSQWRELLRPFRNLRRLQVPRDLIRAVSRSLEVEDGESPMELLPGLEELSYSGSRNDGDAFTKFIVSRQNAGHPVALINN